MTFLSYKNILIMSYFVHFKMKRFLKDILKNSSQLHFMTFAQFSNKSCYLLFGFFLTLLLAFVFKSFLWHDKLKKEILEEGVMSNYFYVHFIK